MMSSVGGAFVGVLQSVDIVTVESIVNKSLYTFCELEPLLTWVLQSAL